MAAPEVPTFDDYFIPVLQVLADGGIKKRREIIESASVALGLTDEQRTQTVPSGEPMYLCLLYTSPSPRDRQKSRMPSSA